MSDNQYENYADNEPVLVMKDRRLGYMRANVDMVCGRAARIIERYTKPQMLEMLKRGEVPEGYTQAELRSIADATDY